MASTSSSSSSTVVGFEFPRELERQIHDNVLLHARVRQRAAFRPGVTSAGKAVDVLRQERTAKKIAKALKTLQDEYAFAADDERKQNMVREALQYTNKLEDALQFLALQFTSDELPLSLRATPGGEVTPARSGEGDGDDGELAVTVNARPTAVYESIDDDEAEVPVPVAEVAESWDELADDKQGDQEQLELLSAPVTTDTVDQETQIEEANTTESKTALSWTQQYLQVIAEREEEEARQVAEFAKLSPEEKYLIELEAQFRGMLMIVQQAKNDKLPKKKQKNLGMELQLLRQRLSERGWSEQEFYVRENKGGGEEENGDVGEANSMKKKSRRKKNNEDAGGDEDAPVVDNSVTQTTSATAQEVQEDNDESADFYGGGLFGEDESSNSHSTITPASVGNIVGDEAVDEPVEDLVPSSLSSKAKTGKGKGDKKKAAGDVGPASWTGKSPRDHIQDYCKKNKLPKPVYKKLAAKGRTHLYSLVLDMKTHKKEYVVPDDCAGGQVGFSTIDEAKDTVTTHALYDIMPALPLYRVLPPLYRDMWLEWVRAKEKDAADAVSTEKAGFDAVVNDIFDTIPDELRLKVSVADDVETETKKPVASKPAAEAVAGGVLEDWAVDDWDADLSDSENKDEATEDWEEEYVNTSDLKEEDAESTSAEVEEEDPALQAYSQQLKSQLQSNMRSKAFKEIWTRRQDLPITSFKSNVLQALDSHNVILISGETGCGKSTQVPQFLLEDTLLTKENGANCNIVCTQPRRLAAISLAERVSQELGEHSMGSGDSLCGFQIRLENRMTKHMRLLFCTTGILLRKLQDAKTLGSEISHIIVDEVHERDLQNDVLLSMLRQFLAGPNLKRKFPLKVILMSATLNAASFQKYFGGEKVCPMLSVPGRTFPVQEFYLEDVLEMTEYVIDDTNAAYIPYESVQNSTQIKISGRGGTSFSQKIFWEASDNSGKSKRSTGDKAVSGGDGEEVEYSERTLKSLDCIDSSVINYELIQELIEHLVKETELVALSATQQSASILVFLPGLNEISTLLDMLGGHRLFRDERKFSLLPLHSSLSPQDQQRIFQMPRGIVRVIATTNIAETSLTVEDVKVVIDSGRVKEMRHNSTQRTNVLDEIWISRANAKQRMGRAGRTSGGVCYRLFPKYVYKSTMDEQPVPEIKRAPLTSLCLQIKTFGVDVSCGEFLGSCLDPPEEASVRDALNELFEIGALDREQEKLTTLGLNLAKLPVDVKVGKMLLLGALFDAFDPISTCAAILETKSPFVAPYGHQSEMQVARKRFAVGQSDLLTDVNAYEAWRVQFLRSRGGGGSNNNSKAERDFCREHFLSQRSMREITKLKQQFYGLVAQAGYLPKQQQMAHELLTREQVAMTTAILFAGLAPNLVHIERSSSDAKKRFLLRDQDHTLVVIHPSSINHKNVALASSFLTYAVKLHTSQIYLPTSSLVLPVSVCLFSHSLEILSQARVSTNSGAIGLRINEWVMLQSSYRSAVLLQELRNMAVDFVATTMENPPFLTNKQSSEEQDISYTQSLKKALRALMESEYEAHDPKQALTKQLSTSLAKK